MANTLLVTPTYSLATQKLERWAEARDSLFPKTTTTGGSNVTQPQALGNLFSSRKLKGNCAFTAQSTIVGSVGTEGVSNVKPEGEKEAEFSEGETKEPQMKLVEQIS